MNKNICNTCNGARLKNHHEYYQIDKKHIGEIVKMDISELKKWIDSLMKKFSNNQQLIAKDIIKEVKNPLLHKGIITLKKVSNGPAPKL